MEDFLWIIILAAVFFGSGAKSRTRKKATETPKEGHGEAWPSWDKASGHPSAKSRDEAAAPETTAPEKSEERIGRANDPSRLPAPSASPQRHSPGRYSPEHSGQYAEIPQTDRLREFSSASETPGRTDFRQTARPTPPHAGTKLTVAGTTSVGHNTENGTTTGIGEEFDPRKAILYSEIMRPRFEEEWTPSYASPDWEKANRPE